MIRVVAWLWRDENYRWNKHFRYGPEHVNRLRSMVRRHLSMDHEFVCICDDPIGLDPDIRIVPLWDDLRELGGCYTRLRAFAPDMAEIIGERFVWIDVDCVVTGDLTPLLDRPEDFVIWRNAKGGAYCGSMVMMTAGARAQVWDEFDPVASPALSRAQGYIGTDQAWIQACLGPEEAVWTPADGVLSRYHVGIRSKGEKPGFWAGLPDEARIVFFHGPVDPSQPQLQERHPWITHHWR